MMKAPLYILSVLLFPVLLLAQPDRNQKFAAAGYLGLNLSQIDGDYYFGYNQPGWRFGVETQYLARPKFFFSLGIGFAQSGSRPSGKERDERAYNSVSLRLNSVEVPLLFNYRLGNKAATGSKQNFGLFRSGTIQLGLALNRLTGYRISSTGRISQLERNQNFTAVEAEFEDFDLRGIVGATVRVGLRGAIFVQHDKSILGLYRPGDVGLDEVLPLYPYSLTFGVKYVVY
jgi:hypothetical protein